MKYIQVNTQNKIALITLNRPEKLNALNSVLLAELSEVLHKLKTDKQLRVLIVTGAGDKAFVAGADIAEFSSLEPNAGRSLAQEGQSSVFDVMASYPKPIIAAINGFALGGGLELALASHIRIASETAQMGQPEVLLGLIPGYGGTQRLPQLVGKGAAFEMMLTGSMISAQRAYELGLVNLVVPAESLISSSLSFAEKLVKGGPFAQSKIIESVEACYHTPEKGFQTEINCFGACFETDEFIEGTSAFLEKRKPKF